MSNELLGFSNLRSVTANSTGVTSGYRMCVSGATNANVGSVDSGATGSAVSGAFSDKPFAVESVLVHFGGGGHTGVSVFHVVRPGTQPAYKVLINSGVSGARTYYHWKPQTPYMVPASDTISVENLAPTTSTSMYITCVVRWFES